jgi:hypothetical protein
MATRSWVAKAGAVSAAFIVVMVVVAVCLAVLLKPHGNKLPPLPPYRTVSLYDMDTNLPDVNNGLSWARALDDDPPPTTNDWRIPLTLWSTGPYTLKSMPAPLKGALQTWVMSGPVGLRVRWFDDGAARQYVADNFPQYLPEYDVLVPGAFKADLWRLLVVWREGGVYVDCGNNLVGTPEALGRLWRQMRAASIVLADDSNPLTHSIFQGFFAARPRHPILAAVIAAVVQNVRNRFYGTDCLDVTGPRIMGKVVRHFVGRRVWELMQASPIKGHWRPGLFEVGGTDGPNHAVGPILMLDYRSFLVFGTQKERVMDTKVPGYYTLVYRKHKRKHYRQLWAERAIYRDDEVYNQSSGNDEN